MPLTICCASSLADALSCSDNLALMPASCCAVKIIPACFSASMMPCAFASKSVVVATWSGIAFKSLCKAGIVACTCEMSPLIDEYWATAVLYAVSFSKVGFSFNFFCMTCKPSEIC